VKRLGGMTLVELLIAVGVLLLIAIASVAAYGIGVRFQTDELPARRDAARLDRFERKLRSILESGYLSVGGTGAPTYFVAGSGDVLSASTSQPADALTFTATWPPVPGSYMDSRDPFEALNAKFGPVGGLAEVSISATAVGDAGDRAGPYLRVQRPADGDITQGGFEETLDQGVTSVTFEFFDGTAWVTEWDTFSMPEARLPSAIRATYRWRDDPESDRTLIVRLPLSDVTPENPAAIGGGTP
jgi:hypothetical protein